MYKLFAIIIFSFLIFNILSYATVEYPTTCFPSIIEKVMIHPEQPTIDKEVRVSAYIYSPEISEEKILEVYLHYSTNDGETWNKIDTTGNVTTELPPTVKFQEKKEGEKNLNWLPRDNSLVLIYKDEDDDKILVADELDILNMYAGIDDKYLYLKIELEGEIPTKVASDAEPLVPLYQLLLSNTDKKDEIHELNQSHNYLYYCPLYPSLRLGIPICGIGAFIVGRLFPLEFKEVDYFINKTIIYMRIKREELRGNPKERIKLILRSLYFSFGKYADLVDISSFIYIYFTAHSYEVKKGKPTLFPGFSE